MLRFATVSKFWCVIIKHQHIFCFLLITLAFIYLTSLCHLIKRGY